MNTLLELSLNILDLVQNSLTAGASFIALALEEKGDVFSMSLQDNGRGMSPDLLRTVTDPFTTTRTTRRMGFGLPFVKQLCDMTQGALTIQSVQGEGTRVVAHMGLKHLDRPPLGDIGSTVLALVVPSQDVEFLFTYKTDAGMYTLDTREIKATLEGMPLSDPAVIEWLQANMQQGLMQVAPTA